MENVIHFHTNSVSSSIVVMATLNGQYSEVLYLNWTEAIQLLRLLAIHEFEYRLFVR